MNQNKDILKMQYYAHSILKGNCLQSKDVIYILERVQKDIFMKEPNILSVNPPIYVVGGIGGNFDDFLSIFDIGGPLPYSSYLFLGNYTENNGNSLKTILLLFIYKYLYKENFFLVRGINEINLLSKNVDKEERNKIQVVSKKLNYTLDKEIMHFFNDAESIEIWESIKSVFNVIPITAIVGQLYFCTDSQFKVDEKVLSIEHIRKEERTVQNKGNKLIKDVMKKFLEENKLNFLIIGLNSNMSLNQVSTNPSLIPVYSSPHTVSSDCFIIEINESKISKRIKMQSIKEEKDDIYSIANELILY